MKMNRIYLAATVMAAFIGTVGRAESKTGPILTDTAPLTEQSVVLACQDGSSVRVDVLGATLFRIRHSKNATWTESALNRYGIFTSEFPKTEFKQSQVKEICTLATSQAALAVNTADGSITLSTTDGNPLTHQAKPKYETNGSCEIRFSLTKDERLYGLGDASRDNIMRRGGSYEMWVLNVKSYIPVPMMLSNRGWGMLMNTTWRNTFDMGKTDPDAMICSAPRSDPDYYLFCGSDYRSLLKTYASFTGHPALLPIWGYAFTYVCNENIDVFNMMNETMEFRKQKMPCDVIGLEPGWMAQYYDQTTAKKWDPKRFPIPYWAPKGPHTFIGALSRQGFKLSLWLCCDYDLGVYEEQKIAGNKPKKDTANGAAVAAGNPDDFEKDERLNKPAKAENKAVAEKAKEEEVLEPWFEHLKKFVDQGVKAFKLDGCAQVVEHPKREWGNGMSDEQMHNLFPVIYAKQMSEGFEEHAKTRSMVYSAGGYAGVQKYVATWAGDTGGGAKPLVSMLNLGISGHSNHSCDMDVFSSEGIHFGFLQTWAQQNNWAYWRQPWLLEKPQMDAFRKYAQLRYKLLPYLYSAAAEAAMTGYPVMRAMSLAYPDDPAWDLCKGQYLLGDSLLVSAYSEEIRLPPGNWIDFWSGAETNGPATLPFKATPSQGGALLVKAGAIIPTWPLCDHVEKGWSEEVELLVYPAQSSSFTLHEDDGATLDYRSGKFAQTLISCGRIDKGLTLTIGARKGSYTGMPTTRNFTAHIRLPAPPSAISLDGTAVTNSIWDASSKVVSVQMPNCGNTARVLMLSN